MPCSLSRDSFPLPGPFDAGVDATKTRFLTRAVWFRQNLFPTRAYERPLSSVRPVISNQRIPLLETKLMYRKDCLSYYRIIHRTAGAIKWANNKLNSNNIDDIGDCGTVPPDLAPPEPDPLPADPAFL